MLTPPLPMPAGLPGTVTSLEPATPANALPPQTRLDTLETNHRAQQVQPADAQDLSIAFRHSGWKVNRSRVMQALVAWSKSGAPKPSPPPSQPKPGASAITRPPAPAVSERRLLAFKQCGQDSYVESLTRTYLNGNTSTDYRLRQCTCHDRFCLPCSQSRSSRIRDSLLQKMYGLKDLTLITLTLKAAGQDLTTIVDRAYNHLRDLRKTPVWKAVHGGAAILETKLNGDRWHVHWHIVCQAKYLPQKDLSATWLQLTKDSMIVDIRRVGSLAGAASYVTKYVTKAGDQSILNNPDRLQEAIVAFTGRRLVTTFGSWRGLVLIEKEPIDEPQDEKGQIDPWKPKWEVLGSLNDLIRAHQNGDPGATYILNRLKRPPPRPPDAATSA